MKLNKKRVVLLLKEEYNTRLNYFLNEKLNPEIILDPESKGLKCTHKSGLVYTFYGYTKDGKSVVLLNPDEAREGVSVKEPERVLNDFKVDGSRFEPEYKEVSSGDMPSQAVDYITIPIEEFANDYIII